MTAGDDTPVSRVLSATTAPREPSVGARGRERPRQRKTSEVLARDIAANMLDSGMESGARLPNERDMLDELGVGRATLREALRLLESWGLVTIRTGPGGGPVVRRPAPQDFTQQLSLMLQFHSVSLGDISDARLGMEPMLASLAAERITEEELAELRETIEIMSDALDSEAVFTEQNQRFHSVIAGASRSNVLQMFQETLKQTADGVSTGVRYSSQHLTAIIEAHKAILVALEARDPQAAAAAVYDHLADGRRYIQRRYATLLRQPVRWLG